MRTSALLFPEPDDSLHLDDRYANSAEEAASPGSERSDLSPWSCSALKRAFDLAAVLCVLPLLVPVYILVALAIRFTSPGPVLFLQKRIGCNGRPFTILKFRTMIHRPVIHNEHGRSVITTASDLRFTPVGPFLRRWKLDELPQLLNVLQGEMSLVGPRPKVPEHQTRPLSCRPGITGAATLAFAREERALDRIPRSSLQDFYNNVVLPAKQDLDAEYMAHASFVSDLRLILASVFRKWDSFLMVRTLRRKAAELHHPSLDKPLRVAPRRQPSTGLHPPATLDNSFSAESDSVA